MTNLQKIKIANPSLENELRTYLTADVDAAATDLPVLATTGFVISGDEDYYILAGQYGQEKTEIKLIDAGTGTNATNFRVAALTFSHEASDPITFMRYNQIKIYGATSDGGDKTPITLIDIDCSQQYTEYSYEDTTYDYFYITYFDSTNEKESDYSNVIHSTSYTRKSCKRIIESGLRKAMTKIDENLNSELNWNIALEVIQDGIDEILVQKRKWFFLHKISTDTTISGTEYISKPTDISLLQFIVVNNNKINYVSNLYYDRLTHGGDTKTTGEPTHYTIKNNKYYLYPTPDAIYDVIYEYYKRPAEITTLATEIDIEFVSILIYYCASQFAGIRGNDKTSERNFAMFQKVLNEQIVEMSDPIQSGDSEEADQITYNDDYII